MKSRLALCSLVGLLVSPMSLNAATITFDNLGLLPSQTLQTSLSPISVGDGYFLSRSNTDSGTDGVIINADGSGNSSQDGQDHTFSYLTAHSPGQSLFSVLDRQDGASFSLQSLQYQGWNNNHAPSLIVTGSFLAGGSITQTFNLTNFNTSPYQTASFSPAWSELQSISFSSPDNVVGVFQIDNISVTTAPIPEPETYAMLLAGLGLLGFAARRRKLKLAA